MLVLGWISFPPYCLWDIKAIKAVFWVMALCRGKKARKKIEKGIAVAAKFFSFLRIRTMVHIRPKESKEKNYPFIS